MKYLCCFLLGLMPFLDVNAISITFLKMWLISFFKNHKFHQATLASNQNQANFTRPFWIVQIICNGIPSSTNTG